MGFVKGLGVCGAKVGHRISSSSVFWTVLSWAGYFFVHRSIDDTLFYTSPSVFGIYMCDREQNIDQEELTILWGT